MRVENPRTPITAMAFCTGFYRPLCVDVGRAYLELTGYANTLRIGKE